MNESESYYPGEDVEIIGVDHYDPPTHGDPLAAARRFAPGKRRWWAPWTRRKPKMVGYSEWGWTIDNPAVPENDTVRQLLDFFDSLDGEPQSLQHWMYFPGCPPLWKRIWLRITLRPLPRPLDSEFDWSSFPAAVKRFKDGDTP